MEELTEVITAAECHPIHCNLLMYSSSKGSIKLNDMRVSALCDQHVKCMFVSRMSTVSSLPFSFSPRLSLLLSRLSSNRVLMFHSAPPVFPFFSRAYHPTVFSCFIPHHPLVTALEEEEDPANKSFFTEILASINDIKFSPDGRYIISRDYLTMKIWDVNMESKPIKTIPIHDYVRQKLVDLYDSECLFDKFECNVSGDGK